VKSTYNFLSYSANKQTNKQTDKQTVIKSESLLELVDATTLLGK